MFMLKMCIRKFAAAVTKSIAGGSSWKEEFHRNHWKKMCDNSPPPVAWCICWTVNCGLTRYWIIHKNIRKMTLSQASSAPSPFSCSCEYRVSTLCWNSWHWPQIPRTCWSFNPAPREISWGEAGSHKTSMSPSTPDGGHTWESLAWWIILTLLSETLKLTGVL